MWLELRLNLLALVWAAIAAGMTALFVPSLALAVAAAATVAVGVVLLLPVGLRCS